MIRIRFTGADGQAIEVAGRPGQRLLDLARDNGQPLEGTCNGDLACATCHVIVDPADFPRLPAAREEEEDMLDLAPGATRTSRLSCQIVLTDALDGLRVRIP
ncbi:2Fe-2S iron-sulfur cluster-binding protein [Sphingomonas sp. 1P08PE]|uniref:2Fe-2S iron-sulfur cluster-binding protein n=1 Tax=Sphingomonas sp. 1P08PE TaxID=554122 RepID=UPI0039A1247B